MYGYPVSAKRCVCYVVLLCLALGAFVCSVTAAVVYLDVFVEETSILGSVGYHPL